MVSVKIRFFTCNRLSQYKKGGGFLGFQGKIYLAFHLNSHLFICKILLDIGWNSNFFVCIANYKNWDDEGLLERGKLFVAISGVIGKTKSFTLQIRKYIWNNDFSRKLKAPLNVTVLKSSRLACILFWVGIKIGGRGTQGGCIWEKGGL